MNFYKCPICNCNLKSVRKIIVNAKTIHSIKKCAFNNHNVYIMFDSKKNCIKYRARIQFDEDTKHQFIIWIFFEDKKTILERDYSYGFYPSNQLPQLIKYKKIINISFDDKPKLFKKLHSYFNFV